MKLTPLLTYLFVISITPGPNNIMSMYLSAHFGLRGAKKFIIASSAAFFLKVLLCGMLNVALAEILPGIVPYLKWAGACYLLYLAARMLYDGFRKNQGDNIDTGGESTYRSGIILQLMNMKSWIASLSMFSIYVVPYTTAAKDMLLVAVITQVFMIVCTLVWAGCGSALRRVYDRYSKAFSAVMATSLVWCAVAALK